MSWAIVKNNQVIEILSGGKAVTINGIQYPSSIFSGSWSKLNLKILVFIQHRLQAQ